MFRSLSGKILMTLFSFIVSDVRENNDDKRRKHNDCYSLNLPAAVFLVIGKTINKSSK